MKLKVTKQFDFDKHNQLYFLKVVKTKWYKTLFFFIKSKATVKNMLILGISMMILGFMVMGLSMISIQNDIETNQRFSVVTSIFLVLGFIVLPYDIDRKQKQFTYGMIYFAIYIVTLLCFLDYINSILNQFDKSIIWHIIYGVLTVVFLNLSIRIILFVKKVLQFVLATLGQKQGKIQAFIATVAAIVTLIASIINLLPLIQKVIS